MCRAGGIEGSSLSSPCGIVRDIRIVHLTLQHLCRSCPTAMNHCIMIIDILLSKNSAKENMERRFELTWSEQSVMCELLFLSV